MSRSAPSWLARTPGEVYTLHFWPPYGEPRGQQAKHYTGWASKGRLVSRLVDHAMGRGARLTQVQRQAGGSWVVADVEPGTADREAQLKERGASRRCSVCKAVRAWEASQATAGEALSRAGWEGATLHERGLLLEMFGLDAPPPALAASEPAPEPVKEIRLSPGPRELTPEQLAEMDALVDALCAQWNSPKAEAETEAEMELEAG